MTSVSASLSAVLTQQQSLSPQQQTALKFLRMDAQELLAEAAQAAEENPLLECDEPAAAPDAADTDRREGLHEESDALRAEREGEQSEAPGPLESVYSSWGGASGGDGDETPAVERVAAERTLRDDLLAELGSLTVDPLVARLTACLIEELDESGFLTTSLGEVAEGYARIVAAPEARWREALELLQTFDPPGVGASGPTEALALQVERRVRAGSAAPAVGRCLAGLIRNHLRQIAAHDRRALLHAAGGDEALLDRALALLQTLNPHPASGYSSEKVQYVIADIVVRLRGGVWRAELNPQAQPGVRLTQAARGLSAGEGTTFGRYLEEARRLVSSIEARQNTLLRTATFAVERQQAFFTEGPSGLVPLAIGEAAAALGLSDSTVSRAVSGKFFQCPLGVFELRSLFLLPSVLATDALGTASAVSPMKIRRRIRELVAAESSAKPLSDQAITDRLNEEGFDITRRTVAKYRDLEGIPAARLRRNR